MVTKQQEYISSIFKNLGFAFLMPVGTIGFQFLIYNKIFSLENFLLCLIISSISWFFFSMGYNSVQEKDNDR